ncbi:SPOR domain-containing protein [Hyphococcus flavus]|uniref:SPOR domain-containing protein n=1 Tax=Hyphococcus flavus TaxID=1866326 RepID=A0AAE9ZB11_9PROT|nr:SPOR domain-containing protein [Hyphococcus flavus]WDI30631.1 SPOR domain-containing protein [Hyphococcus flavus]
MTNAAEQMTEEPYEEEDYQEYDEFDDDDEDRGLSGFAVLIMGIVMIGAFVSVVWIAYKQGMKVGGDSAIETPYVAADPDPIKIETADNSATVEDREVYDALDGENSEPVTTLAEGPEEPVTRTAEDTIGSIAADAEAAAADMSDEVEDRLADLEAQDAEVLGADTTVEEPVVEEPAPETTSVASNVRPASRGAVSALSGTHVVQVGAFRSNDEAMAQWARMQSRLGDYLSGKGPDVEVADLGDRGVYHRLRIGPFSSSDEANTYCSGLKERGQDCLPRSN